MFLLTPEAAAIQWQSASATNFVVQDAFTNIFLVAFTTAWAHLKLYSGMDNLGRDILYHDIDSIIYAQNGVNDLPVGNCLGEFTSEMDDGDIITLFVSGTFLFFKSIIWIYL